MAINVTVIDDGSVAIRGAADALRTSPDFDYLGHYPSLGQPHPADQMSPLVLITDLYADAASLAALPAMPCYLAVLVMSAFTEPTYVLRALHAGVRGYIGKDSCVSTLFAAVHAVGVGGIYLSRSLDDLLIGEMAAVSDEDADVAAAPNGLTPRERDVLIMVAQGLTHKQIGTRLSLSKATVDTYVHRVRQKVGSVNKAGLTRVAMELELLPSRQSG